MSLLEVKNLKKIYSSRFSNNSVEALKDVSFTIEQGEYVAIMGESGSGKTTLLNILATLDKPTDGYVLLENQDITKISDKKLAEFRRNNLGFVFQDFNLLNIFNNKDNILLPLVLANKSIDEMTNKLNQLCDKLDVTKLLEKYPYEISGGQKQRVAIARALITSPKLVLADEPTGALDSKASQKLLNMFKQINHDGNTILMVTHSSHAASHASRVLFIKDGEVFHQIYRGNLNIEQMHHKINETLALITKEASYE